MTADRRYPDEPAGPFEPPPESFVDREGREIEIRRLGAGPLDDDGERGAVYEMYRTFDHADRAQGLPPSREKQLREWLDVVLGPEAVNVQAWHGNRVAGHSTLVPDGEGASELAIFVHQDYQHAGIGGRLIRRLLGAGAAAGIELVWLTVERWNRVAIDLYHEVGFETTEAGGFEFEMAIRLG